jgi:ABC-type multidrug transport system ATPase subunit
MQAEPIASGEGASSSAAARLDAVEVRDLTRRFGKTVALDRVSLSVRPGRIRGLLGPNGAGKTTLLRCLVGLTQVDSGHARVLGLEPAKSPRELRRRIGVIPTGDRSFYLRISGLENLVFFARLHGLRRRDAVDRALELMERFELLEARDRRVGLYSHGMQKRLAVARAFLGDPEVILVDEATHDLDPDGARRVRVAITEAARDGAAVLWTTQRVEEVRGFVDELTLLDRGRVRFAGTVPELLTHAGRSRYLLRLRNGSRAGLAAVGDEACRTLGGIATVTAAPGDEADSCILSLGGDAVLGDAVAALAAGGVQVVACHEERSEIESAFLRLTVPGDGTDA